MGRENNKRKTAAAEMFRSVGNKTRPREACPGCYHNVPSTSRKTLHILMLILPSFREKTFLFCDSAALASQAPQKGGFWKIKGNATQKVWV